MTKLRSLAASLGSGNFLAFIVIGRNLSPKVSFLSFLKAQLLVASLRVQKNPAFELLSPWLPDSRLFALFPFFSSMILIHGREEGEKRDAHETESFRWRPRQTHSPGLRDEKSACKVRTHSPQLSLPQPRAQRARPHVQCGCGVR